MSKKIWSFQLSWVRWKKLLSGTWHCCWYQEYQGLSRKGRLSRFFEWISVNLLCGKPSCVDDRLRCDWRPWKRSCIHLGWFMILILFLCCCKNGKRTPIRLPLSMPRIKQIHFRSRKRPDPLWLLYTDFYEVLIRVPSGTVLHILPIFMATIKGGLLSSHKTLHSID